jgi:hypothetical protein
MLAENILLLKKMASVSNAKWNSEHLLIIRIKNIAQLVLID